MKLGFHACPDEEGITTSGVVIGLQVSPVFTRALMKKGLRRLSSSGIVSIICFHACPDEEGITTTG